VPLKKFDNNFLLNGKSIRNEKDTVKEKDESEGKGTKRIF